MLKKKSNSFCCDVVRESAAMKGILTRHVSSEHNPADIAMKIVLSGLKCNYMVSLVLDDIAGY